MDVGTKAALCVLLIFALSEAVKRSIPLRWWQRLHVWLVFVLGVVVVIAVAHSVWAHSEIVNGKPLDELNSISQVIAGLLLAAAAVGLNSGLAAVSNIGQNQALTPTHRATGSGAPVAGTGLTGAQASAPVVVAPVDVPVASGLTEEQSAAYESLLASGGEAPPAQG